jgi:hypothetical protein
LNSSNNVIQNSRVSYTGLVNPGIGEGIYVGTATAKLYGLIDNSDGNSIIGNTLGPFITAEHIDIKEDTRRGVISNNVFDATGQTGIHDSDTVVNLKGEYYQVYNNVVRNMYLSGFKVSQVEI